jgi:hypothetical protein
MTNQPESGSSERWAEENKKSFVIFGISGKELHIQINLTIFTKREDG